MEKRFFQIFCALNIIAVLYCNTENVNNDRSYDLQGLITRTAARYENSLQANRYGVLHQFKFGGLSEEKNFEPSENLLKNSSQCKDDIKYTLKNLMKPWAMEMFDSFGKPESGILQGNLKWIGDYNECVNVSSTNPNSSTIGNFRGKYCLLNLVLSEIGETGSPFGMSIALCIPDSCSGEELEQDAWKLLDIAGTVIHIWNSNFSLPNVTLQCKPTERHLNNAAISMIALLSIFLALMVLGSSITAYKYFKKIIKEHTSTPFFENIVDSKHFIEDQKSLIRNNEDDNASLSDSTGKGVLLKIGSFLNCFCLFTNGCKILNTKTSEGELLCIHGIRFLSMCWVILGHTYLFGISETKNLLALMDYVNTFFFQIILQGFYSVDSFFVLSGFLLTYLAMNEFAKSNGRIPWIYFYIHRYIRLTPIYMILLGFSATIYLYLGSGPYWPDGDIDKLCQDNWWKNLLYINNFYNQTEQCMAWSWYLANDMQFFAISPLFLITLWQWPVIGYSLIAVFMVACWISNFYITYHFGLMAGVFNVSQAAVASIGKFMDYFNAIYIKPYTRISPYLIGILTGYLLHKRKQNNYSKHGLVFLSFGWIASCAIGLICVFGLYHQNPPLLGNSVYNALSRTAFALSLAWVIYACLVGQGGFVNQILSYKLFIPLSRLTYAAYLIHPMIVTGYFASMKTSMEFNHPEMVYLFLGFLVVTYAIALPVALMLESPIIALEKWIRKSFAEELEIVVKQETSESVN